MTPTELALKAMIEDVGICGVLTALANVCEERSAYLATTLLDTTGAKVWAERSDAIENMATTILMQDD